MKKAFVLVAGLVAVTVASIAAADPQADEQFCEAAAKFRLDITSLRSLGPQSTVAEVRTANDRVQEDLKELQSTAGKMNTPTAKQFIAALGKLNKDVDKIPSNATMAQVKQKIDADVANARATGQKLAAESGCPAQPQQNQQQDQQQPDKQEP